MPDYRVVAQNEKGKQVKVRVTASDERELKKRLSEKKQTLLYYDEIAKMCFDAVGKPCVIKRAPVFLFDILIFVNALKKNGKADIIKFSKFTLTGDLVGEVKYGKQSFSAYLEKEMKA